MVPSRPPRIRARLVAALVALGVTVPAHAQTPPLVAAAADLGPALTEIAGQFRNDTGQAVEPVFGSSGTLARQIRDGAPFELFLSADESFVDTLAQAGATRDRGTLYAVGRIVLFAPTGSPLDPAGGFDALRRLLDQGRVSRFAIANPAHAPYGRAAEAALRTHGLWPALQPRLVLGENVAQASDTIGIRPSSWRLGEGLILKQPFGWCRSGRGAPGRQLFERRIPARVLAERGAQVLDRGGARAEGILGARAPVEALLEPR